MENNWHVSLFKKSVLKQHKLREIKDYLGNTNGLHCLDIGSDNGVISYFLREGGGTWCSADLNEDAVASIQSLVGISVYKMSGGRTDFDDNTFDVVVIVDFLEHIEDDRSFIQELYRIVKPEGKLIINVPHLKKVSILHSFQHLLGQTDEVHGHLRPGYNLPQIAALLNSKFTITAHKNYSRFFSEFIDAVIKGVYDALQKGREVQPPKNNPKGLLVTESSMTKHRTAFFFYSLLYPFVWLIAKLDYLLFLQRGYLLMVSATCVKSD